MDLFPKVFIKNYKPTHEIQLEFLTRLHRLLSIGYPLMPALERTKWEDRFVKLADTITQALTAGKTIDEAFELAAFHPHIVSHLYLSRTTGNLEKSISKAADTFRDRIFYFNKIKQITRYPLLLLFIFCILLFLMKQIVLPSFSSLFQSTSASSTLVLFMLLVDYVVYLLVTMAFIGLFIVFLWPIYTRKVTTNTLIKIYQSLPLCRSYIKAQTSLLFAAHFSSLLKTGISYYDIVQQMSGLKKQRIISFYSSYLKEELSKGYTMSSLLASLPLFDKKLSLLFNQDASSVHLTQDLDMFTEVLTEEMKRRALRLVTYIQPVFFVVLAGFIIFIYITIMWPMYELIKTI